MIIFNMILFLLVAVGQLLIYWSFRKHSIASSANKNEQKADKDRALAKRLATIALTDFLCWFPIGLLGKRIS